MTRILGILNNLMQEMGLNYTYDVWDEDSELPQWIGEMSEIPTLDEDGCKEYDFILTGFSVDIMELLTVSDEFQKKFKPSSIIDKAAIRYKNTIPVENGDATLKQIQITLNIKDWSV